MLEKIKVQLNRYSANKIPFVGLLSYDMPEYDIVCKLSDAHKFGLFFKFYQPNLLTKSPDYSLRLYPMDFEIYQNAFNKVIAYMRSGDVYLLNLCFKTPFSSNLNLSKIYEHSNAQLVLHLKEHFVCFTPEKFITIKNDKITTFPMKGTISAEISDAKQRLLNNEKEFSEQAMITDLMRNDLSIVSEGVRVDKFRYFDEISTPRGEILQTSTQISGNLLRHYVKNYGDLFEQILPAGSITGTPKIRACEIIKEVEECKRGFYSGVFIHFDGKICQSYVLIRFVEQLDGKLVFKSGGGITVQSEARKEFHELLQKAYFTF